MCRYPPLQRPSRDCCCRRQSGACAGTHGRSLQAHHEGLTTAPCQSTASVPDSLHRMLCQRGETIGRWGGDLHRGCGGVPDFRRSAAPSSTEGVDGGGMMGCRGMGEGGRGEVAGWTPNGHDLPHAATTEEALGRAWWQR
jgi:hypothetical protein